MPRDLTSFFKKLGYGWRRWRKGLRAKQNPQELAKKKGQLELLEKLEQEKQIDLFYLDESGFCLTPCIPYAWQEKGQVVELPCSKSKRLSVLGFYNRNNEFYPFSTTDKIDSKFVIEAIDTFVERVCRPTVLVLDNASLHRSKLFVSKIEQWMAKDLYIFYLPKYSPHLNIIETLWRFIKYEWIQIEAYLSWENLVKNLENIFDQIGSKFTINFT